MTTILTIMHKIDGGAITSRNIDMDDAQGWTDCIMQAQAIARAQAGVFAAQVLRIPEGGIKICKTFQPHELVLDK